MEQSAWSGTHVASAGRSFARQGKSDATSSLHRPKPLCLMEQGSPMKLVGEGALLDRESQMPLPVSINQGSSVLGRMMLGRMKLGGAKALLDRESQMPLPVSVNMSTKGPTPFGRK